MHYLAIFFSFCTLSQALLVSPADIRTYVRSVHAVAQTLCNDHVTYSDYRESDFQVIAQVAQIWICEDYHLWIADNYVQKLKRPPKRSGLSYDALFKRLAIAILHYARVILSDNQYSQKLMYLEIRHLIPDVSLKNYHRIMQEALILLDYNIEITAEEWNRIRKAT